MASETAERDPQDSDRTLGPSRFFLISLSKEERNQNRSWILVEPDTRQRWWHFLHCGSKANSTYSDRAKAPTESPASFSPVVVEFLDVCLHSGFWESVQHFPPTFGSGHLCAVLVRVEPYSSNSHQLKSGKYTVWVEMLLCNTSNTYLPAPVSTGLLWWHVEV